jgi:hypothetical protein
MSLIAAARRLWRALFLVEVWNVGLVRLTQRQLLEGSIVRGVRWARIAPRVRLRADPVFWRAPDGLRILYEELPLLAGRAGIYSVPVARMDAGERARLEFAAPGHLSYPQLVEHGGQLSCMPESACLQGVDLRPWDAAAGRFGAPRRILDGPVIDPTLLEHEGHWYLFGGLRGPEVDTQLRLWIAEAPEGPWREHPASPIVSPGGTARSAGPIFRIDESLYRPSQASHAGYGCELCINRIEVLTPTEYLEREQSRLQPDPDGPFPLGLHTLALHEGEALVDGKTYLFHPLAALSKLMWRLRSSP